MIRSFLAWLFPRSVQELARSQTPSQRMPTEPPADSTMAPLPISFGEPR